MRRVALLVGGSVVWLADAVGSASNGRVRGERDGCPDYDRGSPVGVVLPVGGRERGYSDGYRYSDVSDPVNGTIRSPDRGMGCGPAVAVC